MLLRIKKNIKFGAVILLLSAAGFCLPILTQGETGASFYFAPASGSFLIGSTFTVSIFLNTNGEEINTVWSDIIFPPGIIQVTNPVAGNSFITDWLTPPNYSNQSGIISFRGGIPGGIVTSAGLVSSITFRAVSSGIAKIKFSGESKVLLNDGKGTNVLAKTIGGEYQILVPPPEGPMAFSPTHPDSNIWYSDSSPSFSWEKDDGVTGFSWSLSQNPQERPDGASEGTETATSFDNISDGTWYFHIRQQKNGIWGKTSHVAIKIDTAPPKDFTPKLVTYSRLVDYQTMVYFETTDDFSGVDHYEISVIDLSAKEPARSFFSEELSPYKVPYKMAGKYNVIIKSIDRAGNIRETEAGFRLISPLIAHIDGKGLEIRGIFFSWLTIEVLIFIILSLIIIAVWAIIKKNRIKPYAQQK